MIGSGSGPAGRSIDTHLRALTRVMIAASSLLVVGLGVVGIEESGTTNGLVAPRSMPRAALASSSAPSIETVFGGLGAGRATGIAQSPYDIAVQGADVYVADFANNVIREIDTTTGAETVIAGNGIAGYSPNGTEATSAELSLVAGVAVDASGDVFFTDQAHDVVEEVPASSGTQFGIQMTAGDLYTVAGIPYENGAYQGSICATAADRVGDGCPATQATLSGPVGLAFDTKGDLVIADQVNGLVRVIAAGTSLPWASVPSTPIVPGDIYAIAGLAPRVPLPQAEYPNRWGTNALDTVIRLPQGVYVDGANDVFVGEDDAAGSQAPVALLELPGPGLIDVPYGNGTSVTQGDIYVVAGPSDSLASSPTTEASPPYSVYYYGGAVSSSPCQGSDGAGDGCLATGVPLTDPAGMTTDGYGDLIVVNYYNNIVQKIDATSGTASLVAGIPPSEPQQNCQAATDILGDGCPATQAMLQYPTDVVYAPSGSPVAGDLLIATAGDVRDVNAQGDLENLAGTGFSGLYGFSSAVLAEPFDVGAGGYSGDCNTTFACGTPATGELNHPAGLTFDSSGDLYVADTDNERVRLVASHAFSLYHLYDTTPGDSYLAAGGGARGYGGDGGAAILATLDQPTDVAVDGAGDVFVADSGNNRIRMIPASDGSFFDESMQQGRIYTVAGGPLPGSPANCNGATDAEGDGCLAWLAPFDQPAGVAVAPNGTLVVADTGDHTVRAVNPKTGIVSLLVGTGSAASSPPNGVPASQAALDTPVAVAYDASGDLAVADRGLDAVVFVPATSGTHFGIAMTAGDVYTIAGTGTSGYSGDGGPGSAAELAEPEGIAFDATGDLFIADSGNNRVREVNGTSGTITTVAGDGQEGFAGDGGPATAASLFAPGGVALDALGNLFVSDTGTLPVTNAKDALAGDNRVREVPDVAPPSPPSGVTATISSSGTISVSWTPELGFEGALPQGYTVTVSSGGSPVASVSVAGSASSAQVGGLAFSTSYTVTVQATTAGGTGPPSPPVAPVPPPTRICDTRAPAQTGGPDVASGVNGQCANSGFPVFAGPTPMNVQVAGFGGVPASGVAAVELNVTVVGASAPGYLTVWPAGAAQPLASNVNFSAGDVVANLVEVPLGQGGQVSIAVGPSGVATNVVVDLDGWLPDPSASGVGLYHALVPHRIVDTRCGASPPPSFCATDGLPANNAGLTTLSPGVPIVVHVAGDGGIPSSGVSAVVMNVTVADGSGPAYVTVYPGGSPPVASNVNTTKANQVVPNRVVAPLGPGGTVSIVANQTVDVLVDVNGYFTATGGTGAAFVGEPKPVRICDTRSASATGGPDVVAGVSGPCANSGTPVGQQGTLTVQATGIAGVPAQATAVVVNVTVTDPTALSFLTVYPGAPMPEISDLNFFQGETVANLVVATLGSGGSFLVFNYAGQADVVVDLIGWYS